MQTASADGPALAHAASAEISVQARIKDFEAAVLIGSHSELDLAAVAVETATATLLAHKRAGLEGIMRSWGLDPETRAL